MLFFAEGFAYIKKYSELCKRNAIKTAAKGQGAASGTGTEKQRRDCERTAKILRRDKGLQAGQGQENNEETAK